MKTNKILIALTAVALVLPTTLRADDQDQTTGAGSSAPRQHYGMSSDKEAMHTQGIPTDLNKASHIIGMTVKNQKDERLGKVKDIVFNWESGQASYAVLSKSDSAKGTGKYVAVPLNAFKPSEDKKHLVLNVDKNRVENAKGFADNNWPALGSTAFGASSEEIILPEGHNLKSDMHHGKEHHDYDDKD